MKNMYLHQVMMTMQDPWNFGQSWVLSFLIKLGSMVLFNKITMITMHPSKFIEG